MRSRRTTIRICNCNCIISTNNSSVIKRGCVWNGISVYVPLICQTNNIWCRKHNIASLTKCCITITTYNRDNWRGIHNHCSSAALCNFKSWICRITNTYKGINKISNCICWDRNGNTISWSCLYCLISRCSRYCICESIRNSSTASSKSN